MILGRQEEVRMQKRTLIIASALGLCVALAAAALTRGGAGLLHRNPVPAQEQTFVGLAEVIAPEAGSGWVVVQSPRLPGPYHRSDEGALLVSSGDPQQEAPVRIRDEAGAVVEEVCARGSAEFDQMILALDTADGGRAVVILRRDR